VRAPNVTELFAPQAGTFAFVTDPCDVSNRGSGSSTRAANCVTLLANLGLTPTQIANFSPTSNAEASTSRPGTSGGNPLLQEEKGKTWTAGAVLRPRFLPGFSLTTDWYDITLTNTINTFTALQVFQNCVDAPTLSNQFCPLTTRNPTTGFVSGFTLAPQNVARFETSGLDAVLNYRFTLGRDLGSFNIRAVAGYVKKLTFTNSPGAEPDEDVNETDPLLVPKYLGTLDLTWTKGGLTVNYGLAWHNSVMRYTRQQIRGNPDLAAPEFLRLKERWEHDIQVGYAVNSDYTFYAGVNNFTDSKPAFATGGSYVVSPIGRFLYVGVRGNIGSLLGR
jgi:outer membrane receptor protein involved in Fe transport